MRTITSLRGPWRFRRGDSPLPFNQPVDDMEMVFLPHDWSAGEPFDGWLEPRIVNDGKKQTLYPGGSSGGLPSAGTGIYVYDFFIPESSKGKSLRLEFDGVMSRSRVYLNGEFEGGRDYGYSSFALDVSNHALFGKTNRLIVRVENPPHSSRWHSGGGIYREVRLVELEKRHFAYSGVRIETKSLDLKSGRAVMQVSADGFSDDEIQVKP